MSGYANIRMSWWIPLLIWITFSSELFAQEETVCVDSIHIVGNTDTRRAYLMREIMVQSGKCYDHEDLRHYLDVSYSRLFNTGLFFEVEIEEKWHSGTDLDLIIKLKEISHWGFSGNIDLPDRNFNVWWELKESLFDRLNFSGKVRYNNLSGKNNRLSLTTQFGYAQKLQLEYISPYIDKQKRIGLFLDALVSRQQEINYATNNNRQLFQVLDDRYLYQRVRGMAGLTFWPRLFWKQELLFEFHYNTIDAFVKESLNDQFFKNGLIQRYDVWQYALSMEKRDMIPYPEEGSYFRVALRKEGLVLSNDLNTLYLLTDYRHYFKLSSRWSTGHIANGRIGLIRPERLPYNNIRALGWQEDFIRGYEFYLIDGLDYVYFKNSVRYKIIDMNYPLWNWIPFERFRSLPLKVYLAGNFDIGYVNNPFTFEGNDFANTWLRGGGIGLDFVAYYDKVVRLEVSRNHLGEVGAFLHFKFGIR